MNKIFQNRPHVAEVLGIKVNLVDYDETIASMDYSIRNREQLTLAFVNVHSIMTAQNDDELKIALNSTSLSVPDGMPLVWISKFTDKPLHSRVYGPDLFKYFCKLAAVKGYSYFLYGGRPSALQKLEKRLSDQFPEINVVGAVSPPYRTLTIEEENSYIDKINRSNADVLWIGLGCPKQEKWMNRIRKNVQVPVMACIGAAFDFHSGEVRHASKQWQQLGLEWLFRLIQEPRRLAFRYLVFNPLFILKIFHQIISSRLK